MKDIVWAGVNQSPPIVCVSYVRSSQPYSFDSIDFIVEKPTPVVIQETTEPNFLDSLGNFLVETTSLIAKTRQNTRERYPQLLG